MQTLRKLFIGIAVAAMAAVGVVSSPAQATPMPAAVSQEISAGKTAEPAAAGKWKIRVSFFGKSGEDVPLRQGDANFGWVHIQDRHPINETSLNIFIDQTLEHGRYGRPQDGKVTVRYITSSGWFRVVFSEREDSRSGDGRPVGIITAFME
ncbi:hypothetical protein ACGFZB_21670 [Streptomyces cinerochromogenes]|uniref:Secreted protein n=1 Tax=Streptomyces cinerochromogenes TaxID=66422 RepID=A0ABW7BBI0_9ACTN